MPALLGRKTIIAKSAEEILLIADVWLPVNSIEE